MPIIHVEMLKGRSKEQKQKLAQSLTMSFVEACGGNKDKINVIITEVDAENWATGGTLVDDR